MKPTNLLELSRNRQTPEALLAGLMSENPSDSIRAAQNLVTHAKQLQLNMGDYLRLAVQPSGEYAEAGLNGYEASLAYLGLPVRNDFDSGVVLQAAAETFQTRPGTRALFPEVVDDIIQWTYRQDNIESVLPMISQSRNINGNEMITTVIDDAANNYQQTGVIAEGARIPVRGLKTSDKSVKFYKFGGGIEFTYEFERRTSIDLVAPYAARMQREVEIGQTGIVTSLLINGDGVSGAAPVVNASTLAGGFSGNPAVAAGRMNWEIFLKWLVTRAQAGKPIDTIVGNYDMYFEFTRMFATPMANNGPSQREILANAGVNMAVQNPRFDFNVNFAVSSTAPANQLIGFIKNETVEELVENGSEIEESVRAIENQKVRYVRTKNHGYRLIFGDTREILNLDAVTADA